jgi:hypothetical protein
MKREEALNLLRKYVTDDNLIKHMLATEAIMKELANYLGEDIELWGLTGLLHDIDYQNTKDMSKHGLVGAEILRAAGIDERIVEAVRKHNYFLFPQREEKLELALVAADSITGLIVACALVMPDKKLHSVKAKSIRKKFKDKSFAAGSNRELIRECEKLNIPLEKFIELSLLGMQKSATLLEL